MYLDFTKAIDFISHAHLLHKLGVVGHYGIKGKLMRCLTAFLRDRRQRVVCQQTFSNWEPIVSGVPQGALLSPTLFLLYINDLPARLKSTVKLFDDDTNIYSGIEQSQVKKTQLNCNMT